MKAKLIIAVALVLIAAFALTGAAAAANSASNDYLKGPLTLNDVTNPLVGLENANATPLYFIFLEIEEEDGKAHYVTGDLSQSNFNANPGVSGLAQRHSYYS